MASLSREEFDAIEFSAARTGNHREAALQMSRLAASCAQSAEMSRAEAYLRAGEQWLLADDPTAAASGFRRAIADGGVTFADARVSLARALFLLGRSGEAMSLIKELEADEGKHPRLCDLVAELLVEQADLPGALAWATAGVELCLAQARTGPGATARRPYVVPPPQRAPQAPRAPRPPRAPAGGTASGDKAASAGTAATAGTGSASPAAGQETASSRLLSSVPRQAPPSVDKTELRMLLSLRYRIRNDLGLPEDSYDKLLDEL